MSNSHCFTCSSPFFNIVYMFIYWSEGDSVMAKPIQDIALWPLCGLNEFF